MASYNGHELFVEKSSRDGRLFTPEEQESELPFLEGSPVKPQQCVQVNSSISGRKRKLF